MSPLAHKLVLTKPCQSDWNAMTTAGDGRHCKFCNKTVVDFSILKDDEVKTFFLRNDNNPVCGRFYQSQIERIRIYLPSYLFNKPIPYWKKFLFVFMICFGTNLYPFDIITGNPALYAQSPAKKSSGKKNQNGHLRKKTKQIRINDLTAGYPLETITMGFIQMVPSVAPVPVLHIHEASSKSSSTDTGFLVTETVAAKEERNQNRFPAKPNNERNSEFILPARLRYRRKHRPSK